MLCDNCKKNEATILIREIRNGKAVSLNLCAECARKKEEAGELNSLGFNLAEMLFDFGKLARRKENADTRDADPLVCAGSRVVRQRGTSNQSRRGNAR